MHHPASPSSGIGDQPQPAKVDLQLHPRIAVHDRDGRPAPSEPQLLDREAVQGPIRHHHPAPVQQHMHLDQRQVLLQPLLDLPPVRLQRLPGHPDRPVGKELVTGRHSVSGLDVRVELRLLP
jgi:hypothetical protein